MKIWKVDGVEQTTKPAEVIVHSGNRYQVQRGCRKRILVISTDLSDLGDNLQWEVVNDPFTIPCSLLLEDFLVELHKVEDPTVKEVCKTRSLLIAENIAKVFPHVNSGQVLQLIGIINQLIKTPSR